MKKLMFTAAVAAAMGALAIESANTVGYTTKTIPAGSYQILAVQFDGTDNNTLPLSKALQLDSSVAVSAWASMEDEFCIPNWYKSAVHIMVPKGVVSEGYTDLYYSSNAYDNDAEEFVVGWADQDGVYVKDAEVAFLSGHALWVQNQTEIPVTVQVSGQVKSSANDQLSFSIGYNLMKLPYPVALNAGASKIAWGITTENAPKAWNSMEDEFCITDWYKSAIHIMIPKGVVSEGYIDLYYTQNAYDNVKEEFVAGWADQDGVYVTDAVIPEGFGFWIQTPVAFTATVTK